MRPDLRNGAQPRSSGRGFFPNVLEWCDRVDAELDGWGATDDVGMTAGTRGMLDDAIAFFRSSIARHPDDNQGLR